MGNPIAFGMIAIWPLVAIWLLRRLPLERAIVWCILLPFLLLPPITAFDLPLLPPLHKDSVPALALLAGLTLVLGKKLKFLPESRLMAVLLALYVLSPLGTILTNPEPLIYGPVFIPGLRIYDFVAQCFLQFIYIVPFLVARQFLRTETGQRELLVALAVSGLAYSLPALIEVRMSPQMNVWVYGFFQHNFLMTVRYDGFRPLVFVTNSIILAFYFMTTAIAAFTLWKTRAGQAPSRWLLAFLYLAAVLVLCKTLSALLYAVLLVPMIFLLGRGLQFRVAAAMAIVALLYPTLRGAGLVPTDEILSFISNYDAERAGSLLYRFTHEGWLLDRTQEKALFGWGSWGRNQIYNPIDGTQITVPDGRWIIVMGTLGWLGFIAEFGALALPIFLLLFRTRGLGKNDISPYAAPIALLMGANMIELIPNASITPLTWLTAGALVGYAEALRDAKIKGVSLRHDIEAAGEAPPPMPKRRRTVL
ncbi:hypothetical protein [Algicella marina]|uniref:O-antigen ligase domain-containing protein n=1 Tax=Algicella marina TaxID=2683284 RepID=A0A6P1T4I9_9RHOB|nr:hypothetical protein [Algicella marina]QHQ36179.1 hypothetical protein GO499_13865 [Algicella marina]